MGGRVFKYKEDGFLIKTNSYRRSPGALHFPKIREKEWHGLPAREVFMGKMPMPRPTPQKIGTGDAGIAHLSRSFQLPHAC